MSRIIILLVLMLVSLPVFADPPSAAQVGANSPIKKIGWFIDGKGSLWQPTNATTKLFFPAFFNWQGSLEGGFLYNEQIGAEVGAGFFYKSGHAVAANGTPSQDSFKLLTVPMTIGGAYHFLYQRKQWVVPYARGGFEMDFFRESDSGSTIKGLKKGLYGGAGLQVPITKWMDELDVERKTDSQIYVIFEGLYKWVNDFGGKGLNLSGAVYSFGFMVTF